MSRQTKVYRTLAAKVTHYLQVLTNRSHFPRFFNPAHGSWRIVQVLTNRSHSPLIVVAQDQSSLRSEWIRRWIAGCATGLPAPPVENIPAAESVPSGARSNAATALLTWFVRT